MANSASIRSRWFLTSQSTPLNEPPSSSAVSARIRVAIERDAFALEPDDVGHELGRHALVVGRAAAVEEAVLFEEGERIDRPVRAPGLDDVEVGEQQDRPLRAVALQPGDQIALARIGSEDLNIREAGGFQARRHGLRRGRHVSRRRIGGVDLDQLLEDLPRQRIVGPGLRGDTLNEHGGDREDEQGKNAVAHDVWIILQDNERAVSCPPAICAMRCAVTSSTRAICILKISAGA